MHVKVFLGGTYINASSYYSDASYVHTGQLFFNDTLSDLVALQSPYSNHSGSRMLNSADDIYATTGAYTLMNIQYVDSASGMSGGLITSITLGVTSTSSSSDTTAVLRHRLRRVRYQQDYPAVVEVMLVVDHFGYGEKLWHILINV